MEELGSGVSVTGVTEREGWQSPLKKGPGKGGSSLESSRRPFLERPSLTKEDELCVSRKQRELAWLGCFDPQA